MAPPTRPQRPQPNRSNNSLIVIVAIVCVAVVIGIVAVLVLSGDGDDDDEASVPVMPSGVAICEAEVETDSSVSTVPDAEATLAPFPDDDIFKPVTVEGAALPAFTVETEPGADPALCTHAPVVSGYDYDGNEITIDPANDGPTLVVLLAHWCPHCNREIPVLNEWRDSGEVPDSLNIVGVSTGVRSDAPNYPPDEWLTTMDWEWPVLADADVSADGAESALRAYGATSYPTMVLIGSDSRVLVRFSGEFPVEAIQEIVDDALEQDAAPA